MVNINDIIHDLKEQILDKGVDKICNRDNQVYLKQKDFIKLSIETNETIKRYKEVDKFNFEFVDSSRKEIMDLKDKHKACLDQRGKYLFGLIIRDKILIGLGILFCILCFSLLVYK